MPTSEETHHKRLMHMTSPQLVRELVEMLGAPLTAMVAGVRDTRSVRQWMAAEDEGHRPRERTLARLRTALQVVEILIADRLQRDVIQAWFTGMNPLLEDRSPALVLADGADSEQPRVLQAARRFAE
jgi:hypothetical protein